MKLRDNMKMININKKILTITFPKVEGINRKKKEMEVFATLE